MLNEFTDYIIDEYTSWFEDAVVQIGQVTKKVGMKLAFVVLLGTPIASSATENYGMISVNNASEIVEKSYSDRSLDIITNSHYEVKDEIALSEYRHELLRESLKLHRGEKMTDIEKGIFNSMAVRLATFGIKDCFVRFEEEDRHVSLSMLFEGDVVLNVSQYYNSPDEKIVFSIEKDDKVLYASYTSIEILCSKLPGVINKLSTGNNGISQRDFA